MDKNAVNGNVQQREGQIEGEGKVGGKNKYATPRLVEYGTIAKLTRTGTGVTTEGGMGSTGCL